MPSMYTLLILSEVSIKITAVISVLGSDILPWPWQRNKGKYLCWSLHLQLGWMAVDISCIHIVSGNNNNAFHLQKALQFMKPFMYISCINIKHVVSLIENNTKGFFFKQNQPWQHVDNKCFWVSKQFLHHHSTSRFPIQQISPPL